MSGRESPELEDFQTAQDLSDQLQGLGALPSLPTLPTIEEDSIFTEQSEEDPSTFSLDLNLDGTATPNQSPSRNNIMPVTRSATGSQSSGTSISSASLDYAAIPQYSGHPEGTRYGDNNQHVEHFSITSWVSMFEKYVRRTGMTSQQAADAAATAMVTGEPAGNWFATRELMDANSCQSWEDIKAGLLDFFKVSTTNAQMAEAFRAVKQKSNELTKDYKNRALLRFALIRTGLSTAFQDFQAYKDCADPDAKALAKKAIEFALDFVFSFLFLCGLKEEFVEEILAENLKDVDQMVEFCGKKEGARHFLRKHKGAASAIGAVAPGAPSGSAPPEQDDIDSRIAQAVAHALAAQRPPQAPTGVVAAAAPAGQPSKSKKSKDRSTSGVFCHFCGKKGHYASKCKSRKQERDQGRWRATIYCPKFLTKEQWNALSDAERQLGQFMIPDGPAPPAGIRLPGLFDPAGSGRLIATGGQVNYVAPSQAPTYAMAAHTGAAAPPHHHMGMQPQPPMMMQPQPTQHHLQPSAPPHPAHVMDPVDLQRQYEDYAASRPAPAKN